MVKLIFWEFIDRDDFAQPVYPHGLGQIDGIEHRIVIEHDVFDHIAIQGQLTAHGALIVDEERIAIVAVIQAEGHVKPLGELSVVFCIFLYLGRIARAQLRCLYRELHLFKQRAIAVFG